VHQTSFRARKVIGSFEKPGQVLMWSENEISYVTTPPSPVCVSKFVPGSSSSDFWYWCRWKIITGTIVYIYRMLRAFNHRYPKGDTRTLSSVQISQLFYVSTKTIRGNLNEFQLQSQDFSIFYAAIPLIINFLTTEMSYNENAVHIPSKASAAQLLQILTSGSPPLHQEPGKTRVLPWSKPG